MQVWRIDREIDIMWCSRRSMAFARALGFSAKALWEIAITVSELATNVLKFAGGGTLTLRRISRPRAGIEVIAEDEGSGFEDMLASVNDGFSEGRPVDDMDFTPVRRGLGAGLGGVRRMTDRVTIENKTQGGSRVAASKWLR